MSNTPVVYSEHDRFQVLLGLAHKVTKQVADNPDPHDHDHEHDMHLADSHVVGRSK